MAGVNTLAYYDKATITAVNLYSAGTRVEVADSNKHWLIMIRN